MKDGPMKVGMAAVAASACFLLALFLQAPTATNLHTTVSTRPAVHLASTGYIPQARAVRAVVNGIPTEADWQGQPEDIVRSTNAGRQSSLFSLALVPLAIIAGYFAGKQHSKVPIDPVDMSASHSNSYSMLSVGGVPEAEAEGEEAPVKQPAAVEKSYAKIIAGIEKKYLKDASEIPDIQIGDTVVVGVRIREGQKERVQDYSGIVICMRNGGLHKAITVRAILQGIGVERVFPVHAPQVAYIKITKRAVVRRAKLFYLRSRSGKAARLKQRLDRSTKKSRA